MPSFPIQLKRNGTAAATPSSLLHGEVALNYADGKLFWKDASNVIQSFTFQAYALASHTHAASEITSGTLDAARIANDSITYAKLQNVSATDRLLGRSSAGSGDVEEITCTAFGRSLIDDADAAAARTTLSVQPTASPAFTGAATFDNTGNVVPLTVTNTGTANSFVVNDASGDTTPFVITSAGDVTIGTGRTVTGGSGGAFLASNGLNNDLVTTGRAAAITGTWGTLRVHQVKDYAGLRIIGDTSQTASYLDVENSSGTTLVSINSSGQLLVGTTTAFNATDGIQIGRSNIPGIVIARTEAPTSTASIAGINASAYDGSAYVAGATINFRAAENWSSTNHGTDIQFRTTPTGSGGSLTETLRLTGAGQLLVTAGSASACGVAFGGDPDTGIAQLSAAGANTLSICTGGGERVRVDANGRVGVGVTPASAGSSALQVRGDLDIFGNGADRSITYNVGVGDDGITGWYRAKIAFVPSGAANNISQHIAFFNKDGDNGGSTLAERARITAGGEVLIGTTTDNGAYLLQVNSQIYATNATIATSDARFKANVQSLTDATAVIEALRPVAFDFIPHAERNFAAERQVGLIAQEAQAALAGCDYAASVVAQCGDHLGLAYEKLVPVLIKALQESNARIAALEERLNHA